MRIRRKSFHNLKRRVIITFIAIIAGLLPVLMPQWMTSLAAYGYGPVPAYGYGVYYPVTKTLSLSEIIIPLLDYFTNQPSGENAKFSADLEHKNPGVGRFEVKTIKYEGEYTGDTSNHAIYSYETRQIEIPEVKIPQEQKIVLGKPVDIPDIIYKDVKLIQVDGTQNPEFQLKTWKQQP